MLDIPVGAELTFLHDETLIATVVEDRKVRYEGTDYFLTQITKKILSENVGKESWGKDWTGVRGSDFWLFQGEILTEMRLRLEDDSD